MTKENIIRIFTDNNLNANVALAIYDHARKVNI